MKGKRFLSIWAGVALMAAAALGLAGCATGGSGGASAPAVQLAADINAIQVGSAEVDGGTVRLSGGVRLETGLTVPAGVTLDLSAEGADIELQDGAVNATGHGDHGAGWVDGGIRIGNGAATINGSGSINLKSKGELLYIGKNQKLTLSTTCYVNNERFNPPYGT